MLGATGDPAVHATSVMPMLGDRTDRRTTLPTAWDRPRRPSPWPVAIICAIVAAGAIAGGVSLNRRDDAGAPPTTPVAAAATLPQLHVPVSVAPSVPGFVNVLRGLVDGAATLLADGSPVPIEPGGAFSVLIPQGTSEVVLVATAADGSSATVAVAVTDQHVAPSHPPTAALHVRAEEWANPVLREQLLDLARAGRIDAVELDIKDESGHVGHHSAVPLAGLIGAVTGQYDAAAAVAAIHQAGARVIGRIVCFLDPTLAGWAWSNGRRDLLVLDASGSAPLANGYGTAAFSNPASSEVQRYQIDLATEAAALGFDDILYDYVRRPEGDLTTMQLPGATTAPAVAIARFVLDTATALPDATALGVSVFGISATRPEPTGQDIRLLAPHVDYVAPMVYPSHWGAGEYGVADPVRQPADIVARSVADFERVTAGSGAAVVPWLQDFSSGDVEYGPTEVRAQIDAARSVGAEGFLLWNPGSSYHVDALDPPNG
jgi:hypothetical protein